MVGVSQLYFFPPDTPAGYDANHCIRYILAMNVDVELEEPPNLRHLLLGPPSNEEYQKLYNDRIRTISQDALKQEELFYRHNKWVPGLATRPCLFPYPQQGQVSDLTAVTVTGSLFNEGQRMIHLVNAAIAHSGTRSAIPITSSSSSRVQHPWNTKPPLKQTAMKA